MSLQAALKSPFIEFREWKRFQPHIEVHFERGDFLVKTVTSIKEWYAVLRFRKEVFLQEYGVRKVLPFGLDIDRYDWNCDQLMVMSKSTGKMIGCYRILCSEFTDKFYSESEFDLGHIKRLPGVKVELGRACVHPEFRNGVVMQLLWRGIADYIRQTRATYAFGCTSIKTVDPITTRKMETLLTNREALAAWPPVAVKSPFRFGAAERAEQSRVLLLTDAEVEETDAQLPSLLKFYLRLGAKLCGHAALDRKFGCIDFFTLFDIQKLPAPMREKYNL